jgi:hypothetical protein
VSTEVPNITKGAKRAVIVLFVLSFLLAGTSMMFTVYWVSSSDHKFCQVIQGVTAVPVKKPANPSAAPVRESQYEWHQKFAALGRSLGC